MHLSSSITLFRFECPRGNEAYVKRKLVYHQACIEAVGYRPVVGQVVCSLLLVLKHTFERISEEGKSKKLTPHEIKAVTDLLCSTYSTTFAE